MAIEQSKKQGAPGARGKAGLANQQAKKAKKLQKKRAGKRRGGGKKELEAPKNRDESHTSFSQSSALKPSPGLKFNLVKKKCE
ncbi:hypothetical protein WAI453_002243 [Rhynchosporium graminicola]